jgi:hypothetical protein
MRPPNYRRVKETYGPGTCRSCLSEVDFDRRLVCIKHLAYVRINGVCDDWKDGNVHLLRDKDGEVYLAYKEDYPTEDERLYLAVQKLTDEA